MRGGCVWGACRAGLAEDSPRSVSSLLTRSAWRSMCLAREFCLPNGRQAAGRASLCSRPIVRALQPELPPPCATASTFTQLAYAASCTAGSIPRVAATYVWPGTATSYCSRGVREDLFNPT